MFGLGLTLFVVVMVLSVYFAGRLAPERADVPPRCGWR